MASRRAAQNAQTGESQFGSVTADFIVRTRDAQPFRSGASSADQPKTEYNDNGSVTSILARKGDARPSLLAPPPPQGGFRADPVPTRNQIEDVLSQLRAELTSLRSALADRDAALARAAADAKQARENRRQKMEAALSRAMAAWKANEAARFAEAERRWREQSASELAEARAQAKAAMALVGEAAEAMRDARDREVRHHMQTKRIRDELAELRTTLADRENELTRVRGLIQRQDERVNLRPIAP